MSESFTITPAGTPTPVILLGDDQSPSPRTVINAPPLPEASLQTQVVMPLRAARAVVYARGNALVNYSWTVVRWHDSITLAEVFRRDHPKEVLAGCAVGQFKLTRQTFTVTMRSTGALTGIRCVLISGVRTVFTYTWQGTPFEP